MPPSVVSLEGSSQSVQNPLLIQLVLGPPILQPCLRGVPRERAGMNFLGELLFAGDHHDMR